MAHVKGRAGLGAINQIVNYRLTGDPTTDVKPKSPPTIGAVAGSSAGPGTSMPMSNAPTFDSYSAYYNTYHDTYNTAAQQFFAARTTPLSGLSNIFDEREIPIAFGGYGEIRTAEKLNALPDTYTVFHNLDCVHTNGYVSANIDHLVIGPNSAIVIDTKVWGTPLQTESHVASRAYLPYTSPYWSAIETCLYELTFLPRMSTFLIIAVGGKAGKALASIGPLRITDYITRPNSNNGFYYTFTPCPLPVIIVAQTDIVRAVTAHDNTALACGITQPPFSVSEIENEIERGMCLRQDG